MLFPGDLSDFPFAKSKDALAMSHTECMNYCYSLDSLSRNVSSILGSRFSVVCFRPCSFRGNFACFSNFVPCDNLGNPQWDKSNNDPSVVLLSYLDSLAETLSLPEISKSRLVVAGFSKGAVVLGALLRSRNRNLLERVDKFLFIDPGLSIPGRLFPFTNEEYDLFPSEIPIEIYVTGYQMADQGRPWLRAEILDFASRSGAVLRSILSNSERTLDTHFQSITVAVSISLKDSY